MRVFCYDETELEQPLRTLGREVRHATTSEQNKTRVYSSGKTFVPIFLSLSRAYRDPTVPTTQCD